ncbi:hypothetical protein BGZ76_004359 [Entomortierella beljakovae]|nr:hypothetical protein BGZ76_004359 [Entomortierella beljakovae]
MSPVELRQVTHEELVIALWKLTYTKNPRFLGNYPQALPQETEQQASTTTITTTTTTTAAVITAITKTAAAVATTTTAAATTAATTAQATIAIAPAATAITVATTAVGRGAGGTGATEKRYHSVSGANNTNTAREDRCLCADCLGNNCGCDSATNGQTLGKSSPSHRQECFGDEVHGMRLHDPMTPNHGGSMRRSISQESHQSAPDGGCSGTYIQTYPDSKSSPSSIVTANLPSLDATGTQIKHKETPSSLNTKEYQDFNNANVRITNRDHTNSRPNHDQSAINSSNSDNHNNDSLATPSNIPYNISKSTGEMDDRISQQQQLPSPRHLLQPGVPIDVADYFHTKDVAEHPRQRHPQTLPIITTDGTVVIKKKDLELNVNETFLHDDDPYDPLLLYHSRLYLSDPPSISQLIDVRFVFAAHQIPRGTEFAHLVGHLRFRHTVDTYLIPHESTSVYEDQDIVFGMTGTLDRVRRALHDFLRSIVPRATKFTLWRFCLLVPRAIVQSLIGSHDDIVITGYAPKRSTESLLPVLRKAMAGIYGPIRGAKQEHLLTLESCSFTTVINAVYFVAKTLGEHNISQDSYQGYYRGGRRSVIPKEMKLMWDNGCIMTNLDPRVPAGYVLRPGVKFNLKEMHKRKFHFQFYLRENQVEMLAGESGVLIRSFCKQLSVSISISDPMLNSRDFYRRCNIGGDELESIARATVAITDWLNKMLHTREREMVAFIPFRVQAKIQESCAPVIRISESIKLSEPEGDRVRLEPDEEEYVLKILWDDEAALHAGIVALLEAMYDKPTTPRTPQT